MIKSKKYLEKKIALSLILMSTCFAFPNLTDASDIIVNINDNDYIFAAEEDVIASSVTKKFTDNSLAFENGNVTGSVYGAKATSNIVVKGNVVNLTGGSIVGKIKGGYAGYVGGMLGKANATGNSIKVSGTENLSGSNISAGLYAGYAGNESLDFMSAAAQVAQNPLSILSLAQKNTADSTALQNITSMTAGARTEDDAYGGYAKALLNASANQNIVNIDSKGTVNGSPTTVNAFVVGGYAAAGLTSEALGNTIIAENAELVSVVGSLAVVGAGSVKTSSDEKNGTNSVTVKGGSFSRALGGYSRAYFSGNSESNGSVVDVRDAIIAKNMIGDADFAEFFHGKIGVIGGFTQADNGNAEANANIVNVDNIKSTAESYQGKEGFDFVIGGVAVGKGTSNKLSTVASNNKVEIISSQADLVAGGLAQGIGAQANGNIVTIKGNNTVLNDVYGGSADKGTANNNIVNWHDGFIKGSLYGGFAANSENNILNIYDSSAKKTLTQVENFQKYNFYINEYTVGEKPLLTINNSFVVGAGDELTINLFDNGQLPVGLIGDGLTIVESVQGIINNGANISLAEDIDSGDSIHRLEVTDNAISLVLKEQNKVEYIINGRNVNGDAILGFKPGAELRENKLTIAESGDSATIVNGNVYVAKANTNCNAVHNTFMLQNGTVTGNIYGSYSEAGTAGDNVLELSGGKVKGLVYGGFSESGNVGKNTLKFSGSEVEGDVYGGFSKTGAVSENTIELSSGKVKGAVYGGFSESGNVGKNTLKFSGSEVEGNVYGGFSKTGLVYDNVIKVGCGDNLSNTALFGSNLEATGTNGNILDLTSINEKVSLKAMNNFDVIMLGSGTIEAREESNLNNSKIDISRIGLLVPGETKILLTGSLTTEGLELTGIDFSKYYAIDNSTNGVTPEGGVVADISSSAVKLTANEISDVIAGLYIDNEGKRFSAEDNTSGKAKNGSLIIKDLIQNNKIVSGVYAEAGAASKGLVHIEGDFKSNIYGGFAENGAAINNIVNISNPINGNGVLYGGFSKLKNVDVKTGNTLNVKAQNISLGGITNFDTLNFYIGKAVAAGATLVKIQDKLDLKDVKVNTGIEAGSKLVGGDLITLLEAKEIVNFDSCITGRLNESDYAAFDFDYEKNNNQLNIKLQKLETTDNSKSLVETQMAGLTVLSQSADLRANSVFQEARAAVQEDKGAGFSPYAAIGGNKLKLKTGSHVDVLGWNFNLGLAKNTETKHGSLLLAPIFEYGHGNYDSYLDNGYHGEGRSHYWGAGVMAKKSQNSGLYYEGSICGGKLKNDYKAKENSFETESPYISVHAGIGKLIRVNTKDSFDFYSKYFYIHEAGDTTTVNTSSVNHGLKLENINSNRSRLGLHFKHTINSNSHYYAGLAWMHEFSGKARATLDGAGIIAPSIKGDSGVLELGWRMQPVKGRYDLALDMAGYTGKQKGGSVNLKFSWNF